LHYLPHYRLGGRISVVEGFSSQISLDNVLIIGKKTSHLKPAIYFSRNSGSACPRILFPTRKILCNARRVFVASHLKTMELFYTAQTVPMAFMAGLLYQLSHFLMSILTNSLTLAHAFTESVEIPSP
jgi:hypothetical protein